MTNDIGITSATGAPPVTTMASAMFFGTITFAAAALATRSFLTGDNRPFKQAQNPRSTPLDIKSYSSVYTLLYHTSVLGLILYYAYVCENHPPFPHAEKHYDADQFFFLTFLLFVVSAYTWKRHTKPEKDVQVQVDTDTNGSDGSNHRAVKESNDATEILNRDQTEEWKGWMQFMFLLYHYFHAEPVYNSIRIMITSYVWMTGFGNFSFFYLKADYGWVRVLQMLWRLNFLVLFLCLTQGTTYILYYICLLHTYYFLMVYFTMRIGSSYNHTKWFVRGKMAVLALIIFVVWDVDSGLFKIIHYPFLGTNPILGANNGGMWEWYFRSSLDHWSTFLGMVFALNFPITSLFYRKLEAQPLIWHVAAKGAVGMALFAVFYWWVTGPFQHGKFEYNQTNSYYGFIPLITYIYFRNLTPWLRNHTLELLHQIGKTTLETYLMQHHIWLTSDAKSLLTLVPGYPKINFLLVSLLYVFLSRRLYQLTLFLRGMMLPDDRNACFRNLFAMGSVISGFVFLAFILEKQNALNLPVVGAISFVLGAGLYFVVANETNRSQETFHKSDHNVPKNEEPKQSSALLMGAPSLVGALVICMLGISWRHMSLTGAAKIQPLTARCAAVANDGNWLVVDGCDEGFRGAMYRQDGMSQVSTCSSQNPAYVWGWKETVPSSHCRFKQRDPKSLKKALKGRNVFFVGDSITRFMYHSFCRQTGMATAGAYNATGETRKHTNIATQIGDSNVDFLWAAYAKDQVNRLKEVAALPLNPADASVKKRPDLVVLGGGAWDKLWLFTTDSDKKALGYALDDLATVIQHLRSIDIPVVWIVPTTINTDALPGEEKKTNISEEEMELMRDLYQSKGILSSSSFVIDGPAFTSSRVTESYDGVHYPHQVYSAGAQILANSFDWLLPELGAGKLPVPPQPGSMANHILGLMMLCIIFFGIFGFDGFLGFSYLAAIFVPSVSPASLFQEAFSTLHRKTNLPEIQMAVRSSSTLPVTRSASLDSGSAHEESDEESASLLNKES
jgi:hypothetical protein